MFHMRGLIPRGIPSVAVAARRSLESHSHRLHRPQNPSHEPWPTPPHYPPPAPPQALLLPIHELVAWCHSKGTLVLIDGAHGLLATPLDLAALGADYYVGNCPQPAPRALSRPPHLPFRWGGAGLAAIWAIFFLSA